MLRGTAKLVASSLGDHELYDLATDPAETHDLYATQPQPALEQALQEWIRATPRPNAAQQRVNQEQMRRLRSLGYLQ